MRNPLADEKRIRSILKDGLTIMIGGFLGCGSPHTLIDIVLRSGVQDLHLICNDACFPGKGISRLIESGQASQLTASHIGTNPIAQQRMLEGTMQVHLTPQGTLAEAMRAAGAGLGGILTPTGIGTAVAEGKEIIQIDGKPYLLEKPIRADLALVYAQRADRYGNARMRGTARNMNPSMALAGDIVAMECGELIEEMDPELVEIPGLLVDHLYVGRGDVG